MTLPPFLIPLIITLSPAALQALALPQIVAAAGMPLADGYPPQWQFDTERGVYVLNLVVGRLIRDEEVGA